MRKFKVKIDGQEKIYQLSEIGCWYDNEGDKVISQSLKETLNELTKDGRSEVLIGSYLNPSKLESGVYVADSSTITMTGDGVDSSIRAAVRVSALADNMIKDTIDGLYGVPACKNGEPGKNGADGKDGSSGKSAYEEAVENGFVGSKSQWLESLKANISAHEADSNAHSKMNLIRSGRGSIMDEEFLSQNEYNNLGINYNPDAVYFIYD